MSLINDMLRDLDRRGAANQPERGPENDQDLMASSGQSASSYSTCSRVARVWWPAVLVSMAAAGLAVAFVVWFWEPQPAADSVPSITAPSAIAPFSEADAEVESQAEAPGFQAPTSETELAMESAQTKLDAESFEQALQPRAQTSMLAPDESSAEESTEDESRTQEERFSKLLERAQTARSRDRLTRPSDDNAYDYYQQVLVQAPNHPEAVAGLAAIARRYRELVEMALDNNELNTARRYLQRARSIAPEAAGLDASTERLQRLSSAQTNESREPVSAEDTQDESRLSVSPDMESRDRRRAQVARELWAQGDQTGALVALEETLADFKRSGAQAPVSTALLVEFYIQVEDPNSAEALLEQSTYLPISEDTRLKAQLDLHRGNSARALAQLEAQQEAAESNELYRALLARLYFAEEQFPEAVETYRALLSDFGQDPAYWLGLGLAEDAQGHTREALRAFVRARERGGYGPESAIHRYLERRIEALNRQLNVQGSL